MMGVFPNATTQIKEKLSTKKTRIMEKQEEEQIII
jgi:hypothetical protein